MLVRNAASSPLVGTVLGGAYRVVRLIGEGAMGGIYEARQLRLDKRVAIKVMARELAANADSLLRFHREAEVTSRLGHPHIITVFDFGTSPLGEPYLVMEYLEGEDLASRIRRRKSLPLATAVRIVRQVASALAETHAKGIVHRDLKPANVFLLRVKGEGDFAKVLDFGISKVRAASTALTGASTLMGTPMYMAPEQAEGRVEEMDHRTDQWALACIAYEMLGGRGPFVGDDVSAILYQVVHKEPPSLGEVKPPLPPLVEQVIRKALSKRQNDRFQSVTTFARSLEAAASGQPLPSDEVLESRPSAPVFSLEAAVLASTVSRTATEPTERWTRPAPRRLTLWIGAGALAAAAVGLTVLGVSRKQGPAREVTGSPPSRSTAPRTVPPAATPPPGSAPPPSLPSSSSSSSPSTSPSTSSSSSPPSAGDVGPDRPGPVPSPKRRVKVAPRAAPPEPARSPAAAPPDLAPAGPSRRRLIKEL
jgi:serine/threonine-protein kinase